MKIKNYITDAMQATIDDTPWISIEDVERCTKCDGSGEVQPDVMCNRCEGTGIKDHQNYCNQQPDQLLKELEP